MEAQRGSNPLQREPGRRYSAGRIRPRAGADVRRPSTLHAKPTTPEEPDKPARQSTAAKPALPRTSKSVVLRRQMTEHAKAHKKKVKKTHRKHVTAYIIGGVVIVSLGVLVWAFQDLLPFSTRLFGADTPVATTPRETKPESTTLDETPVTAQDLTSYVMAADAPRVVRIPALGVEARVRRVGVSLTGEPIAPSNIFDVGWFEQNGKPDNPGAVLINGHMIGPTKPGIFTNLNKLQPDDDVIIERGDNSVITYKVIKVQEYPAGQIDMGAATTPIDPTQKGLNLMTTDNRYTERSDMPYKQLIVFTIQQSIDKP